MLKKLFIILVLFTPLFHFSQDFSALWEGYFSYYNIKDVSQGNNKIYAVAENAIFSYDLETNEIKTRSTINGLSGEIISTIHYSEAYELIIIGYENGLLEIAFDNDDDILTIVDILDKPTIPPVDKKINHFNEHEGLVYISTDYGISVYDLERLEFGDTYYIGNLGSQVKVKQTVVFEDYIYAACQSGRGLRRAAISSNNLIDYNEWEFIASGNILAVETANNKLYIIKLNRKVYEVVNGILNELFRYDIRPLDVRSVNNKLIVTTRANVFIYENDFSLISQIPVPIDEGFDTQFTSATIDAENVYIGTKDFGVLKTQILNPLEFEEIHPEGPLLNASFSLKASNNNLWVTFGDYSLTYNPSPMRSRGFSILKNENWVNIPFDSVLGARNLNTISLNPFVENQVFISSFQDGLLEVNDDVPTVLYNQTNSDLESLVYPPNPNFVSIRQSASNFDRNGILWTMTGRVDSPLKSYNPTSGQWQGYDFLPLIQDGFSGEWGYSDIVIDNNNTKWIGGYKYGLIGFNENGNQLKSIKEETENMPSTFVTALVLDDRDQIWIGTLKGLRVLYNPSDFFNNPSVSAEPIIILEDGVAKELFFQQLVLDIEVDGSNNKWVGVFASGLFYLSSDGQETIYHFTADNSPLPSNNIIDVAIDDSKGIVYIATDRGLMAFKAGGSAPTQGLENAHVYPNPVRPTFNITQDKVKIKDIAKNVNIKITDIEGNLVAEAETRTNSRYKGYNLEIDGGTAYWNGKNLANNVVASGVYLVMLSDLDTYETKVLKVMVVR